MQSIIFFYLGCSSPIPNEQQETTEIQDDNMISLRIDFGEDSDMEWFVVNDDVMGGVSTSSVESTGTSVIFSGEVSTDNNGGFVSLRSPNDTYELEDYTQVEVAYKSQGHDFTMILADHLQWYMPEFKHELMPVNNEWTTITTSLSEFTQYRMTNYGETATDKELDEETLSNVMRIELRNSNFANGEFQLEIDYIEFQGFLEE